MTERKNKYPYFSKVFTDLLEEWKKENDKTQEKFMELIGVQTVNSITHYKKGYSYPKKNTLQKICEVLDVDESVFTPKSPTERYENDPLYITAVGKDRSRFAKEIGFDMRLLSVLRKLINFEEEFPIYSNIVQTNNKEFIRNPNFLDSQIIQEEELKDLQIQHNDKTITLHNVDLMFLKEVQDQVVKYVKFLFYERSKEMLAEIQSINKDYIRDYVVITVDGNPIPDNEKLAFLNNKAQPFDSVEGFENALQNARESTSNKKEIHIEFKPIDEEFMLKHDRFRITNNRKDGTDNG